MKVMILAAGLGERMRPLTDHTPKPLLQVGGVPLLEHHIRRLAGAGYCDLVINVSHLAGLIIEYFGDGGNWGVDIQWSHESEPLETAGGIVNALPLLGVDPFLVVNGDVWTDYPFELLRERALKPGEGAHLVLVGNPAQHPRGDFVLDGGGALHQVGDRATGLTYAGLGVYSSGFFNGVTGGKLPLRPLLDRAIVAGNLSGEYFPGVWVDVGTPERLDALNRAFDLPA